MSYLSDDLNNVYIDAFYKDGRLKYMDSETNIQFAEGTYLLIKVAEEKILNKPGNLFETEERRVLSKGTHLFFELLAMPDKFTIVLQEDLYFIKKNNRLPVVKKCRCIVTNRLVNKQNVFDFHPIEAASLNQAYFKTSVKYKPAAASHSINIYKHFRLQNGQLLESLRY